RIEPSNGWCSGQIFDENPHRSGIHEHLNQKVEVLMTRTYSPKAADVQHDWIGMDATDVVRGRLATHAAALLRGKHKPTFAPHMDMGDYVIIINAEKVSLSGNKRENKFAYRHSGYPGGLTAVPYGELLEKNPARAVEKAIRG